MIRTGGLFQEMFTEELHGQNPIPNMYYLTQNLQFGYHHVEPLYTLDWLQSLKHFSINHHIHVAIV